MSPNQLYVGETVRLAVRAADPDSGQPTGSGVATYDVWGPGVDRKTTAPVIKDASMTWRPGQRDFVAYLDTSQGSWPAGRYSYRVKVRTTDSEVGPLTSIEYSTFTLNA